MNTVIRKKTFHLGKIAAYGHRKINEVTIDLELRRCGGEPTFTVDRNGTRTYTGRRTPEYVELSICGNVWNNGWWYKDIIMGGQCLEHIKDYIGQMTPENRSLFHTLYDLWRNYHLNGMHAGTPHQEVLIAAGKQPVTENFTGMTIGRMYDHEPYTYGHAWVVRELPAFVLKAIDRLLDEEDE